MNYVSINDVQLKYCILFAQQTANFVAESIVLEAKNSYNNTIHVKLPWIFNLAYTCELFLKAIYSYQKNNNVPKEHNLKKLFNDLPTETTRKIVKYFDEIKAEANHPEIDFKTSLDTTKCFFEKYRYAFENIDKVKEDSNHDNYLFFLKFFSDALNLYIMKNIYDELLSKTPNE